MAAVNAPSITALQTPVASTTPEEGTGFCASLQDLFDRTVQSFEQVASTMWDHLVSLEDGALGNSSFLHDVFAEARIIATLSKGVHVKSGEFVETVGWPTKLYTPFAIRSEVISLFGLSGALVESKEELNDYYVETRFDIVNDMLIVGCGLTDKISIVLQTVAELGYYTHALGPWTYAFELASSCLLPFVVIGNARAWKAAEGVRSDIEEGIFTAEYIKDPYNVYAINKFCQVSNEQLGLIAKQNLQENDSPTCKALKGRIQEVQYTQKLGLIAAVIGIIASYLIICTPAVTAGLALVGVLYALLITSSIYGHRSFLKFEAELKEITKDS